MANANEAVLISDQSDDWIKARIFERMDQIQALSTDVNKLRAELSRRATAPNESASEE